MSLVEAVTNVAVGYGAAVATQVTVFPLFGLRLSLGENLLIGGVFTVVSIVRGYALRRVFEALRLRRAERGPPPGEGGGNHCDVERVSWRCGKPARGLPLSPR
jgi:hypothetical protein